MTFNPPKEAEEIKIPEYDYSLNYTKFRKGYKFAIKEFGNKAINEEVPHKEFIGKNPSICKELFGLGEVWKQKVGINIGLNSLDNHVWIPQVNLSDPHHSTMSVCMNCGSLIVDNKFIPYTVLNKKKDGN